MGCKSICELQDIYNLKIPENELLSPVLKR